MAGVRANATHALGVANATRQLTNHMQPQAVADRASARLLAEQSQEALRRAKATRATPEDMASMGATQSEELKTALSQARMANLQAARMETFMGFQQFDADGNPEHINQAFQTLRQNPVGKNLFSDINRVDRIGPGDEELLKQVGLTYQDFAENPDLGRMFVRATMADGSVQLAPMEAIYAGTQYNRYQTQQQLEEAQKRADIFYKLQGRNAAGSSAAERIAHTQTVNARPADIDESTWAPGNPEYDAVYLENYQKNRERPASETQSEAEATRDTLLQRPDDIDEADWKTGNTAYDMAYQENFRKVRARETQTSAQKEQAQVRSVRNTIAQRAADAGTDFFDIDFSKRENRLKYEQDIQDMMRLGKLELSAEDRRTARYISELKGLGGAAGQMTDDVAGAIDRLTRNIGAYVSNSTAGYDVSSAYSAFRNTIRHALFGSALTDGEIQSFNEQFGTLNQQTGPILAQFRTGLEQVKSQLESIMNLNDSYVSHFYLGADAVDLAEMVEAIDERIAFFDTLNKGGSGQPAPQISFDSQGQATSVTTPPGTATQSSSGGGAPRPSLDELYQRTRAPAAGN